MYIHKYRALRGISLRAELKLINFSTIRPVVHDEASAEPRLFAYSSGLTGDPWQINPPNFSPRWSIPQLIY